MNMRRRNKKRRKRINIRGRLLLLMLIIAAIVKFSYRPAEKPVAKDPEGTILEFNGTDSGLMLIYNDISKEIITNDLILVNMEYPIDDTFEYSLLSTYGIVAAASADIEVCSRVLGPLNEWFEASRQAGVENLYVSSGYRSIQRQAEIYDNEVDKSYVQPPYASEHHTGYATDISVIGIAGKQLGETGAGIWLRDTAWEYGFILRYPQDKTDITLISYEPWHFRYVGLPHAYLCYTNNLCLEEYLEYLKDSGGYRLDMDELSYFVYYTEEKDGTLLVPTDIDYIISRDNKNGYVVTAFKEIIPLTFPDGD